MRSEATAVYGLLLLFALRMTMIQEMDQNVGRSKLSFGTLLGDLADDESHLIQ